MILSYENYDQVDMLSVISMGTNVELDRLLSVGQWQLVHY